MAISTGLALLGGSIAGGLMSSSAQKKAASTAAAAQTQSAELGIEEQRRQFDEITALLQPYVSAGESAIGGQLALAGLEGPEAQQAAITALEQGPQYEALVRQGEEALLQKRRCNWRSSRWQCSGRTCTVQTTDAFEPY